MSLLGPEKVLEEFRERTKSGPVNWEYVGYLWISAYRLSLPDMCFVIRGGISGKEMVIVLEMMDSNGETLGLVAGDSAEPEPSYYLMLGEILRSVRHQAGDPLMEKFLEPRGRS